MDGHTYLYRRKHENNKDNANVRVYDVLCSSPNYGILITIERGLVLYDVKYKHNIARSSTMPDCSQDTACVTHSQQRETEQSEREDQDKKSFNWSKSVVDAQIQQSGLSIISAWAGN